MDETEKKFKQKMEKYLNNAKPLFDNLNIQIPKSVDLEKVAKEFLEMALAYYNDSIHFHNKCEYANALGALEYAEGWLDAGKALGIFNAPGKLLRQKSKSN